MVEKLDKNTRKKFNQMPEVWQSNPFLMSGFLRADLMSDLSTKEAEELGCLLDFTSRMYSDLNMIFYETQYLKISNTELKKLCVDLFEEYTLVIDYKLPLETCRKEDDWENLNRQFDDYILKVNEFYNGSELEQKKAYKMHANASFPMNLIMDFIDRYTIFISDGTKHYQKFQMILESYKNNEICGDHLPERFLQLQAEIVTSIEKFDEAYHISELKGSKLKDLLFGRAD